MSKKRADGADRNERDRREMRDEPLLPGPEGSKDPEDMDAEAAARDDDRRLERTDYADAFMPDPSTSGSSLIRDDLAESLAEEFVVAATTGEEYMDEDLHDVVPEEIGGPFIETSAAEEFAVGSDEQNPVDGTREPIPRGVSALTQRPNE